MRTGTSIHPPCSHLLGFCCIAFGGSSNQGVSMSHLSNATCLLCFEPCTQPMSAEASCRTHPPLFLAVSKMANGSGSADLEQSVGFGSCWGFLFRMRAHGWGCDVPMEWLMPHGAAQGRYVRPTNACCLPKLPVSPFHLCF